MKKLVFATGNKNKAFEIQERFSREGIDVEIVIMDFNEPLVNNIEIVSKEKVKEAYQKVNCPCFVIDSGFIINNYPNNPGYPGAMARRSGISENIDKLLETMKDVKDRTCTFKDCLTYFDGEEYKVFFGIDEGSLTHEKRGVENKAMRSPLWYVFKPKGCAKTLAEMSDEERILRKDGHISAKEQFIHWYKNESIKAKQLVKKSK